MALSTRPSCTPWPAGTRKAGRPLRGRPWPYRASPGDPPTCSTTAVWRRDPDLGQRGYAALRESLRVALDAGEPGARHRRAYVNLAWLGSSGSTRRPPRADPRRHRVRRPVRFLTFGRYLPPRARDAALHDQPLGRGPAGRASALDRSPPIRCSALTLIGRTRARRGEPGADRLLREAWGARRAGRRVPDRSGRLALEAAEFINDAAAARERSSSRRYRLARSTGPPRSAPSSPPDGTVRAPRWAGTGIPHPHRAARGTGAGAGGAAVAGVGVPVRSRPGPDVQHRPAGPAGGARGASTSSARSRWRDRVRATLRLMGVAKVLRARSPAPETTRPG